MNQLLSEIQIQNELQDLVGWNTSDDGIVKQFVFKDFKEAMIFMNKIADYAEELDHHPDWANSYKRVEVTLKTHSIGGVTDLDIKMARRMNRVSSEISA